MSIRWRLEVRKCHKSDGNISKDEVSKAFTLQSSRSAKKKRKILLERHTDRERSKKNGKLVV